MRFFGWVVMGRSMWCPALVEKDILSDSGVSEFVPEKGLAKADDSIAKSGGLFRRIPMTQRFVGTGSLMR